MPSLSDQMCPSTTPASTDLSHLLRGLRLLAPASFALSGPQSASTDLPRNLLQRQILTTTPHPPAYGIRNSGVDPALCVLTICPGEPEPEDHWRRGPFAVHLSGKSPALSSGGSPPFSLLLLTNKRAVPPTQTRASSLSD